MNKQLASETLVVNVFNQGGEEDEKREPRMKFLTLVKTHSGPLSGWQHLLTNPRQCEYIARVVDIQSTLLHRSKWLTHRTEADIKMYGYFTYQLIQKDWL